MRKKRRDQYSLNRALQIGEIIKALFTWCRLKNDLKKNFRHGQKSEIKPANRIDKGLNTKGHSRGEYSSFLFSTNKTGQIFYHFP